MVTPSAFLERGHVVGGHDDVLVPGAAAGRAPHRSPARRWCSVVDQKPTTGTQATSPGGSSSEVGSGGGSAEADGSADAARPADTEPARARGWRGGAGEVGDRGLLGARDDGADDEGAGGDDDQDERRQAEEATCAGRLALEGRLAAAGRLTRRARTTKVAGHAADCAIPCRKGCARHRHGAAVGRQGRIWRTRPDSNRRSPA